MYYLCFFILYVTVSEIVTIVSRALSKLLVLLSVFCSLAPISDVMVL